MPRIVRLFLVLEMHLSKWAPVPQYKTACGWGCGMAACPSLGLLVTSDTDNNTLSVWSLPGLDAEGRPSVGRCSGSGLVRQCILGDEGSPASMNFDFVGGAGYSGYLAFTPRGASADAPDTPHLLLVTDHGHDAVHMIDVVNRAHVGYLAAPGSIAGPRDVAVSEVAPLVAVSAWKRNYSGHHVVHVYRGGGSHWTHVRVIGGGFGGSDGQLKWPYGLRFSGDESAICVADRGNDRASVFRVSDGGFVRHVVTGLRGLDCVEEVEDRWVVACDGSHTVVFVNDGGDGNRPSLRLGKAGDGGRGIVPSALALVPGLGLIVREYGNGGRFQVFSTSDILAMRAMSAIRVGWMTATYRAAVNRLFLLGAKRTRDVLCAAAIAP